MMTALMPAGRHETAAYRTWAAIAAFALIGAPRASSAAKDEKKDPVAAPSPEPAAAGFAAPQGSTATPALTLAPESRRPAAKVLGKDSSGCTWLESEATVVVTEEQTRHQARAAATASAEQHAVQDFLGVNIKAKHFSYQQEDLKNQQQLTESILQTTRLGRILKEKLVADKYQDIGDCQGCRYFVKLDACVMPLPDNFDADFRVELEVSRERFKEGDPASFNVTPTKDSYLYLYDVGMDKETSLIIPDDTIEGAGEVYVKAGKTFTFPIPPPADRPCSCLPEVRADPPDDSSNKPAYERQKYPPDSPVKSCKNCLFAEMATKDQRVSAETIRVIAAKTPLPKKIYDPGNEPGGYLRVMQRLAESPIEWTEDVQAFTIYRH